MEKTLNILLVEDNQIDEYIIRQMLSQNTQPKIQTTTCETLRGAFDLLAINNYDLVFLDLSLPDSYGIDTFINLKHSFSDTPVIVLTSMEKESISLKAIQHGAQDYLIKMEITPTLLNRSLKYAIERFALLRELKELSLKDDLTDLMNRRGFLILGEQLMKTAKRSGKELFVMFSDVDKLKEINDTYGHEEGDWALLQTGRALRKTFRDSDLIARWGGDEFVAMGILEEEDTHALKERLEQEIAKISENSEKQYSVGLSKGFVTTSSDDTLSMEKLIEIADERMYFEKQAKKQG